jgi:hypothetical protein
VDRDEVGVELGERGRREAEHDAHVVGQLTEGRSRLSGGGGCGVGEGGVGGEGEGGKIELAR